MIYFNGSIYEGGWLNDLKHFKGKMIDSTTGDVFSGDYLDGKRNGKGKMYYHQKQEIYDGDWSNDRRQGEGLILNKQGVVSSGDFRADQMEGKLTYQRTLSQIETDKIYN